MASHAQLLERLQARQGAIADEWYRVTSRACYTGLSAAEVRQRLNALTGQAIIVFLGEPFDGGKAEEIGEALAGLHCLQPEPLGRTLGVLGGQLTVELLPEEMAGLQGNLVGLLEGVSAGFFRRARSMILSEQETTREALVHELQMTERALRKVHGELEFRVGRRTAELARLNDDLVLEIAERHSAEKALRESEEKYRELVEEINDVIYAVDPDGTLTYVSPSIESVLGYFREEVEGHHVSEFALPEELPKLNQVFENLLSNPNQENEFRVLTKSGEVRWVRMSSRVVADGLCVSGVRGVFVDVTVRKKAEEALRDSEERWRSLVENAPDHVVTVDRDGRVLFVNRSLRSGSRAPEADIGMFVHTLALPEYESVVQDAVEQVFETGKSLYLEAAAPAGDGAIAWYAANLGPVWRDGKVASVMLIARDITEQKKLDEIKDNLIRDVSHELRNPLAKVQMSLELLLEMLERDTLDRGKMQRISSLSVVNVQRLLETVEGILDLSRLDAGVWAYPQEEVRLDLLVEEVLQYVQPVAAVKGLKFAVALPEDLPPVEGDREKLFRVLLNLMDNAVKFSDEGEIAISAEWDEHEVVLSIHDSGQGVLPENLERIFDRFFQEKTRYQGVGVGLTISRAIVERHGGRIWAESPGRGQGATFKFMLPMVQRRRAGR